MRAPLSLSLILCAALGGGALATEPVVLPDAGAGAERPASGETRSAALGAATPLTPEAAAFRAGLEAGLGGLDAAARAAVVAFYAERGDRPYWAEEGREAALRAAFATAAEHGLPPARYLGLLEDRSGPALEAALTRAYLRLAGDLSAGLVAPAAVDGEINLAPARPEAAALLARLATAGPEAALRAAEPAAPEYRALIAERARLAAVADAGGWGAAVPEGAALREGDAGPRVAALRARLARLGFPAGTAEAALADAPAATAADAPAAIPGAAGEERFDAALAGAVAAFQRAYGLLDDGIVGARTLAALNASPEDRIGQILVNLERMRWLGDLGERYVYVNIPAFTVSVHEDGARVYHTRSVVGQRSTETPEFSETMTYLVVNPTWYIPDSIARRVYLPKLRQDPTVLRRSNMRLFTRAGTEIDPGLVDFAALGPGEFPFRVRQNPSPENALGRVKFMFPNQFAIYLHDTPARELFDRDARAFSNGCIRLEDPFDFAHYLLAPQLEDPKGTFASWVAAGSERYVTLDAPIKVHITYRTAWIDPETGPQFREDIYGRDATLLAALAGRGVALPGPRG